MKRSLLVLAILAAGVALAPRAQAQNYPWCAYYGSDMGGSSNCGFVTFQQCMATVSGNGGFCNVNTQYVPPPGPHALPRTPRDSHRNS
jgi:hypothetical protein